MRVFIDCRELPSESNCSLTISGEEGEVLRAAVAHAVDVHGHTDTAELRDGVRAGLRPEAGGELHGYGTTMVGQLRDGVSLAEVAAALTAWEESRRVPGFLGAQAQVSDDGRTVVTTALFTDAASYARLAGDPEQHAWYTREIATKLAGEPQWTDGAWEVRYRRPAIVLPEQSGAPTVAPTG